MKSIKDFESENRKLRKQVKEHERQLRSIGFDYGRSRIEELKETIVKTVDREKSANEVSLRCLLIVRRLADAADLSKGEADESIESLERHVPKLVKLITAGYLLNQAVDVVSSKP